MRALGWSGAIGVALFAVSSLVADTSGDGKVAEPQKVIYDAASAFVFIKEQTGKWEFSGEHDHGGGSNTCTFRPTAAGSAVIETIFEGEPHEMISMYHMDGDDLLLTHYCSFQNAPVLKFVKSDKPGEIKFVFHGGTNLDPKVDSHLHEGSFIIKDANTIETRFIAHTNGKPDDTPCGVMKRVAAK
jgi:hypothetical protein